LRNIGRRSSGVLSSEAVAYRRLGQGGSKRSIEVYIDDHDSIIIDFVEKISLYWTLHKKLHDHSSKATDTEICQHEQGFSYPFTLFAKLPCENQKEQIVSENGKEHYAGKGIHLAPMQCCSYPCVDKCEDDEER